MLAQLGEHQVEQRADLVGVLDVRRLGGVEHRQQRLGQATSCPIDLGGEMRRGALAVVVEVGLQALGDVLELVALVGELVDLGVDGVGQQLVVISLDDIGRVVALPELLDDVGTGTQFALDAVEAVEIVGLLAHAWALGSLSSSTTSASTISSSLTDPAPADPVWPDADVPAALASRAAAS